MGFTQANNYQVIFLSSKENQQMKFRMSSFNQKQSINLVLTSVGALLLLAPFSQMSIAQASTIPEKFQIASASNCPNFLARGISAIRSVTICQNDDSTYYMVLRNNNDGQETSLPASPVDNNLNAFAAKQGRFTYNVDYSAKKLTIVERRLVITQERRRPIPSRPVYQNFTTTETLNAILMS